MNTLTESRETMSQFQERVDEIRTICRLHACPTGHWENLTDLPLRLSQDASFRSDFVEVIRSFQQSRLTLDDTQNIVVLAIGGNTAPQHSRQLSEYLSLLGSFLSSIGNWPGTDTRPILAPGEIPENIQKFTRPQPRTEPSAPASKPDRPAPAARDQEAVSQNAIPREPRAAQVRLYEASRPEPKRAEVKPLPPAAQSANRPVTTRVDQESSRFAPQRAQYEPASAKAVSAPSSSVASHAPVPSPAPANGNLPGAAAIAEALARLERGNFELRAHLDSIDQRISRMEPLLEGENSSSRTPSPAKTAPTPPSDSTPTHMHRGPFSPSPAAPEPTSSEPLRARNLWSQPSSHPEAIHSELQSRAGAPSEPAQSDSSRLEAAAPATTFRSQLRDGSFGEPSPWPSPTRTDQPSGSAPSSLLVAGAASSAVRFSRFSRGSELPEPAVNPQPSAPASAPSLQLDPGRTKPGRLPRGFFGTAPDPEPDSDLQSPTNNPVPSENPAGRNRRFALIATVFILLGLLAAAALLYKHSIANGAEDPGSDGTAPAAAPRTPQSSIPSSTGPLSSTPSKPPAGQGTGANKVLGSRSAFQPRQSIEEPGSADGFRPAGTFVPASVMNGRLISAPMPTQPRVAGGTLKGIVVLEANISSKGQVEDVYVLGGNASLRSAAIDAVRNWRYKPYIQNGTPIEVRTVVRVDFNEHQSQPAERSGQFPS